MCDRNADHWKISVVQSPPWRRTSCARAGPSGRSWKSTKKSGSTSIPPVGRAVDAQQPGAKLGVELVVPARVERVGDVQPAPVERELDHLRSAAQLAAGVGRLAEQPAEPQAAGQAGARGIRDVVLAQVAVQPVREVQEAIVHRDDHVGDQPRHAPGQRPALELLVLDLDHWLDPEAAVRAVEAQDRCWTASRRRSPARRRGRAGSAPRAGSTPCSPRSRVCSSRRSARFQKCSRLP